MSIWFAELFIGLGLCKDSCQVGSLLEEFVDGGFSCGVGELFLVGVCNWSCLICISTAVMPSLVLLGSFRLTFYLICLARLPAAAERWPAVIAAWRAMIQYC
jgi:hypothetical protein